jgi:hypothetical protein
METQLKETEKNIDQTFDQMNDSISTENKSQTDIDKPKETETTEKLLAEAETTEGAKVDSIEEKENGDLIIKKEDVEEIQIPAEAIINSEKVESKLEDQSKENEASNTESKENEASKNESENTTIIDPIKKPTTLEEAEEVCEITQSKVKEISDNIKIVEKTIKSEKSKNPATINHLNILKDALKIANLASAEAKSDLIKFTNLIKKTPETKSDSDKLFIETITPLLKDNNYYSYLNCGRHLVGEITIEGLEAFYKDFLPHGINTRLDGEVINLLKSRFEEAE